MHPRMSSFSLAWRRLTTIHAAPPLERRSWASYLTNGAAVIAGLLFLVLVPYEFQQPSLDPAFAPSSNWLLMCALRAALVVVAALWLGIARPWRSTTPVEQRQGSILITMTVVVMCLVSIIMWFEPGLHRFPLLGLYYLNLLVVLGQVIVITRQGHVRLGAGLLEIGSILQVLATTGNTSALGTLVNPFVYVIIILIAGLLIHWSAGLVLAVTIPPVLALYQTMGSGAIFDAGTTLLYVVLLTTVAGIITLYARTLEQALTTADLRTHQLEATQTTIADQNTFLQQQSAQLLHTQAQLQATVTQQEERIGAAVAELQRHSIALNMIQTPLLRVASGVLVAPLIGAWNAERAGLFAESLLREIEQQRVHTTMLDMTGLTQVNTAFVLMLQDVVKAMRLLGAESILVGIQPAVAAAFVSHQMSLARVRTAADLAEGVTLILS